MEEDKKLEKRKNIEIVVLSIIIVVLLGALIYLLFIKKDKPTEPPKSQDNQQVENNTNNIDKESTIVEKASYKTKDGKFTLKIIDNKRAYLNDKLFVILNMKEDDKYAHYSGDFDGEATQSGYNFLVDKEKGIIIEKYLDEVSDLNNIILRFYNPWDGDLSIDINYIKCDAGYFFVNEIDGPGFESGVSLATVYTTNWKELGYIDMDNIKSDKNGLYVYENTDGSYNLSGTPIKYDVNGNKIN